MGRLLVLRLLEAGARVAAWDVDVSGLEELKRSASSCLLSDGTPIAETDLFLQLCDLTDPEAIADAAHDTLARFSHIDVLVNNAGIVSGAPLVDLSNDQIRRTFEVNAMAPMYVTRAFLPGMIERNQGHIVMVASAGGLVAAPRLSDYCASKFAAIGFEESLRLELKEQGSAVHTTLVAPFFVDTGMFEGVRTRFSWLLPILKPEYVVDRMMKAIIGAHRRVILPWFVYVVFPIRLLPVDWFDSLISFFGIRDSMKSFRGRRTG